MRRKVIPTTLSAFDQLPDSALVNVCFVALLFGCSSNTVWRRSRCGVLPAPIRVSSQQTRWRVGDVRKSLASLSNTAACA